MTHDFESISANASQLTGADRIFDQLVEVVMAKLCSPQFLESACGSVGSNAPKLIRLNARWSQFRAEFRRHYAELLAQHLGIETTVVLLRELSTEPMRRYVHAHTAMAPALIQGLQDIRWRMGETQI